MNETFYKPSGKISTLFLPIYILTLLIVIPVLSYLYTHIIYFMPFIYLNFFITVGCGLILGLFIVLSIHYGKARNIVFVMVISIISTLLMKYVMWTFYIPLVYAKSYGEIEYTFIEGLKISFSLFRNPTSVLEIIREINVDGIWRMRSIEVKGILLYITWFCEFCILAFSCVAPAYAKVIKPFSEDREEWFKEKDETVKINMPENIELFKANLMARQNNYFNELLKIPFNNESEYLNITLYYLDDVDYGYVTIESVKTTLDKKGKETNQEEEVINCLRIDKEMVNNLL